MIKISDCPITSLKREVSYDFALMQSQRLLKIRCTVTHYKMDGEQKIIMNNSAIKNFDKDIVTKEDNWLNKETGDFATPEEKIKLMSKIGRFDFANTEAGEQEYNNAQAEQEILLDKFCTEYEYYVNVIGPQPIKLFEYLDEIVMRNDARGFFNPTN